MKQERLTVDYIDKKTNREFHVPITALRMPMNIREYREAESLLDKLIDVVRGNESHPLTVIMEIIGENLERYDDEHESAIGSRLTDIEIVQYLMDSNGLVQNDLAKIFGSQANVSKFLNGERPLSKKQILGLKNYFNISSDIFLK